MSLQAQPKWYTAEEDDKCLDPAREAFTEAVKTFSFTLTRDSQKICLARQASSMEEVQSAVADAKARYVTGRQNNNVSIWLSKLSTRISYYGNIMDVLVQHHPQYAALAWGAMKFLFVLVENHEKMTKSLAKGLCHVADSLPRVEFLTLLYPTRRMKQAVANLYAYIIRFLIRAQSWYQESKPLHALHSFTRPAELRYADLIEDIEACTRTVDSLASAGAQAEQRDMHLKLQALIDRQGAFELLLREMYEKLIMYQSVNSRAHLDTNQRLSDLQLSQILDATSSGARLNAAQSLRSVAHMVYKHLLSVSAKHSAYPFWLEEKFTSWKSTPISSLIMIRGANYNRFDIRNFCVKSIYLLQKNLMPAVWVLKRTESRHQETYSPVDLIKGLISQVMRINIAIQCESNLALSCAKFQTAENENEWFELLGSVLAGLSQICIIIDLEMICLRDRVSAQRWPSAFMDIFEKMSQRGIKTVVKVILVSYGSKVFENMPGDGSRDPKYYVIQARTIRPRPRSIRDMRNKFVRSATADSESDSC